MDYYIEHLKLVIEQNGGIISAAELQKEGINRANIYEGLINGIIQKESHGNYVLVEEQPDEFRIIQNRSEKSIFSHGPAFYLHGMSDRVPHKLDITVPQGDNVSRIKKVMLKPNFIIVKRNYGSLESLH